MSNEFFSWNPATLSVHVAEMDNEHQVLIGKMNALFAAHAKKADRKTLAPLVADFVAYTQRHFTDEEAYMARIHYAGLESHQKLHQKLLDKVTQHVAAFEASGHLSEAFFSFLAFWLSAHIQGIDAKYGTQQPVNAADMQAG